MLCTGFITEEEAATSPLIQFKIHACETNEIFLLVADVFASICCEIEERRKECIVDDDAIVRAALHPYETFVRNPWWEVAICRTDDVDQQPEVFAETLRQLVAESWEMLRLALDLDGKGLTETLSMEYMAR
jgi:hypothetical protein